MQAVLAYDPARMRALAWRTVDAVQWLDARSSSEPLADDALATLRSISHSWSTIWMPWFRAVLGDTSMTEWDEHGPSAGAPATRGFAGAPRPLSAVEVATVADEMVRLADAIEGGNLDALIELGELIADHGDEPAVLAEFARRLGPANWAAFVALLASGDVFAVGVARAQLIAARDDVLAALLPTPLDLATNPDFDLAAAVSPAGDRSISWNDATTPGCPNLGEEFGYGGGGFVTGPDGRQYPIVVPWVRDGDGQYTADVGLADPATPCVANLNGEDDGWTMIGYQSGVERFQESPSWAERTLGFFAGTTALVHPLPPNRGLQFIQMAPGAMPYLASAPAAPPRPVGSTEAEMTDTVEGTPMPQAAQDLIVRGTDGWVFATNMDNQRERAYQVIYEENADRRIRARIETFTLAQDEHGNTVIVPEHVWVNQQGVLMSELIRYAPIDGVPEVWSNVSTIAFEPGTTPVPYEVTGRVFP